MTNSRYKSGTSLNPTSKEAERDFIIELLDIDEDDENFADDIMQLSLRSLRLIRDKIEEL